MPWPDFFFFFFFLSLLQSKHKKASFFCHFARPRGWFGGGLGFGVFWELVFRLSFKRTCCPAMAYQNNNVLENVCAGVIWAGLGVWCWWLGITVETLLFALLFWLLTCACFCLTVLGD